MKRIVYILILILSLTGYAQTSLSQNDINAAAGNRFETLLTDVEVENSMISIGVYLQIKGGMTDSGVKHHKIDESSYLRRYEKKIIQGKEKQGYVYIKEYHENVEGYETPITHKVEIWGDPIKVIEFYCGFWSRALDFEDVDRNEVATTRFLTDVATLSFPDSNTAKITVVPAKSR